MGLPMVSVDRIRPLSRDKDCLDAIDAPLKRCTAVDSLMIIARILESEYSIDIT